MANMQHTLPVLLLARDGITEELSRLIKIVMRHEVPLRAATVKIDSSCIKYIKFNNTSNFVKSKLYNVTRKAENRLEMISQTMATVGVQSRKFCTAKKYSLTKTD